MFLRNTWAWRSEPSSANRSCHHQVRQDAVQLIAEELGCSCSCLQERWDWIKVLPGAAGLTLLEWMWKHHHSPLCSRVNVLLKSFLSVFWKGEKLQFVFRNMKSSHPDNVYVVTMGITQAGLYQSKSLIVPIKGIKCEHVLIHLAVTNVVKGRQRTIYTLWIQPHVAQCVERHSRLEELKYIWMCPALHWQISISLHCACVAKFLCTSAQFVILMKHSTSKCLVRK